MWRYAHIYAFGDAYNARDAFPQQPMYRDPPPIMLKICLRIMLCLTAQNFNLL